MIKFGQIPPAWASRAQAGILTSVLRPKLQIFAKFAMLQIFEFLQKLQKLQFCNFLKSCCSLKAAVTF